MAPIPGIRAVAIRCWPAVFSEIGRSQRRRKRMVAASLDFPRSRWSWAAPLTRSDKPSGTETRPAEALPPCLWPLLFLLIPLPFYALSVAYGGVPIFVPAWWPFTHYNVRYGLQLLPAFAAALALLAHRAVRADGWQMRTRVACVAGLFALISRVTPRFGAPARFPWTRLKSTCAAGINSKLSSPPGSKSCPAIPRCSCTWAITSARCSRPGFRSSTSSTKAIIAHGGSRPTPTVCGNALC